MTMNPTEIKNKLTHIGQFVYSTKETQQHSFAMGEYVVNNNIEGDIIECGVASGGNFASMMLGCISHSLGYSRKFWGFDSFEGIQLAGKKDTLQAGIGAITHNVNVPVEELLVSSGITVHPKAQVQEHLKSWGLNALNIELVEGWVQNTIPTVIDRIKNISILRLDMDIYEPTKFTLEKFYPLVSEGGVIIIDDWELDGARIACEEFFAENNINPEILRIENSTPVYFYKKTVNSEKKYTPEEIFNEKFYSDFDKVRFEHFNTLNVDFKDKVVLELGSGIGNHTEFLLEKSPKSIISVEGRKENIDILTERFSKNKKVVKPIEFDLEKPMSFLKKDVYVDWIYNYGLLYHLKNPFEFIDNLKNVPHHNMILETCIEFDGDENNLTEGDTPSQSLNRVGSRPNMHKVIEALKDIYETVTIPENQPNHEWFDIHNANIDHVLKRIVIICENKKVK